jgi:hypothetical protein
MNSFHALTAFSSRSILMLSSRLRLRLWSVQKIDVRQLFATLRISLCSTFPCLLTSFLSHFQPIFFVLKKMKAGLCDLHLVCVSVCTPLSNFECLNQSLLKLVSYHGTSPLLSGVFHKSLPSACVSIPLSSLGNGWIKTLPRQQRIVGVAVFYAFHFAL